MDSKPVFCLITASKCPHCHTFRKTWDDIRRSIESTGLVRIVDIELNSTSDLPDPKIYPKDLGRYVKWFPTFCLFTANSWNNSFPGLGNNDTMNESKLDGKIFNGILENGIPRYIHGQPPTKENLLNWIQNEVSQNSNNKSSVLSLLSSQNTIQNKSNQKPPNPPKILALARSHRNQNVEQNIQQDQFVVPTAGSSICKMKFLPKNGY